MPLNALDNVAVDYKLPAAEIGALLARLAREEADPAPRVPPHEDEKTAREIHIANEHDALEEGTLGLGELSPFTCPECRGVLVMLREGKVVRFRCHTGHAFSADALLTANSEELEARLWDAVRAADEAVILLNRLGEEFARSGNTAAAERCFDEAREAHERSRPVRETAFGSERLEVGKLRDREGQPS
jgi:two-component system chemotaxis response regulator CheB